jgi:DNA polymerase-3 subunit delta'
MLCTAMPGDSKDPIRAELRQARQTGRVHSAYLFEGPAGTGKSETALWFARLLLCAAEEPDPCERCRECLRSALRDDDGHARPDHPDLIWVEPEGPNLRIDQVRSLQRALQLVANEGGWRVGLLLGADRLRTEAANALLKTLEEPPPQTTLVLVAERSEALPRTVRSRVVRLRFLVEPEEEVTEALLAGGIPATDARIAAALGGGTHEGAREWIEENGETARDFVAWVEEASARTDSEILEFALGFRGGGEEIRRRTELFLDVHAAVTRFRVEEAVEGERSEEVERWLRQVDRSADARRELRRRNLNPQLLVESLLFDMKGTAGEARR